MDLGPLRLDALALNFSGVGHGLEALVMRPPPDEIPIATRIIWLTPFASEAPAAADLQRLDARRYLAIRRDAVPAVPRLTRILAPAQGGAPAEGWIVDGFERVEVDHRRVFVVSDPDWPAVWTAELVRRWALRWPDQSGSRSSR